MSAEDPEGEVPIPVQKLLQCLEWVYDRVLEGLPGVDSADDLVETYATGDIPIDDAIDSLIFWQVIKAGTVGFATGIGGLMTLPITLPADVTGVLYLQVRMIAAIARLRGYDPRDDRVRTLAIACLAGYPVFDILKNFGIQVGTQLTRQMILRISGQTLRRINQAVGFRLVTKAGSRGLINLIKIVPFLGGPINGSFDAATTKMVGETAKRVFIARTAE
jgi:uncharacterized protein (DUF697 family)